MRQTAKIFMNGRSQAVRLPSSFRFDTEEVYIRKDPTTGDVILSKKPGTWEDFFQLLETIDVPDDFMTDRKDEPPQERNPF